MENAYFNPFRTAVSYMIQAVYLMVPRLSFLITCSDDSKPYMILKALDESYKNHIGFAIIRASGEGLQPPTSSRVRATVLSSGPERVLKL